MATVASKSVQAHLQPNASKDLYNLSIDGRGTSVLGKSQGDHVTAYRLVEMGLCRALSGISKAEVEELFLLENRNKLREKRSRLYDFISAIAALHPAQSEKLYLGIDGILTEYNTARASKETLRERTRALQDDPVLLGDNLEAALGNIEQLYNKNGVHVRETLTEIVRLTLTFYNHIPHTAYFPIAGFEAAGDEGSTVRTALPVIEQSIKAISNITQDTVATRLIKQTNLDNIIKSLANLMHYPEVTDATALSAHQSYTIANKTKLSKARDNSRENLVEALAKHLHIALAVYPELEFFTSAEIIEPFVLRMIKGKTQGNVLWPTFNNAQDIQVISTAVIRDLSELKIEALNSRYISRDEYAELVSSDDEEEPTQPVQKANPQVALMQELEELRAYKKAIEEGIRAGKVKLAPGFKDILKKPFPALDAETKNR